MAISATQQYLVDCERMIRAGSSTFHKAFSFLPSPRREAVYVLYAFCRMIDDAVDEPCSSPYSLDELEARFLRLEEAEGHFIWPALRWLFALYPVPREPFLRQMQGQRLDLALTRYDSLEQLDRYCYLVAGTVGEMLLPILHDSPDAKIRAAGIELGKAMQIVNIVRDIGEDWRRGRRYVPLELMQRFGCTEADFAEGRISPAFQALLGSMMEAAQRWMKRGLAGFAGCPPEGAFCVELAARTYLAILDQVRANDYDVFSTRAVVSSRRKLAILLDVAGRHSGAIREAALRAVQ
jgi:phytoene/squalene synthetase